jgi:alpha-glucosidase (family GH31 glycosyl hydrolase)
LSDQVQRVNNESAHTGMPMMRPMFLQFPDDVVCKNNSAEAQFMLGSDWLVSPVTAQGATTWPVCVVAWIHI